MSLRWEQVVVYADDPVSLGRWWAAALGWVVVNEDPNEFEIQVAVDEFPGIVFLQGQEAKQRTQNRLHLDFRPDEDQAAEVQRLTDLGARPVDVGQGNVPWVVMADPEGNEFCVLSASTQ